MVTKRARALNGARAFYEKCGQDDRFLIFAIMDDRMANVGQDDRFLIFAIVDDRLD